MKLLERPLNPVLARELKERMRRRRSAWVLTAYLLVLSAVLWLLYLGANLGENVTGPGALRLASLGRSAFQTLIFFMLLLVCFIVPGLCSGAIAGERERQTLVPLQVTLLRPRSILFGKLAASLAFVVFLVFATLPLVGVSFVLGGVEVLEVVRGMAMVLVTAAVVGCLSLACSALLRRVQGATVVSYAVVLFLLAGTFVVFGAQMLANRKGPDGRMQVAMWANPLMATADVLSRPAGGSELLPSPFTPLQELIDRRERDDSERFGFGSRTMTAIAPAVGFRGDVFADEPQPLPAPAPAGGAEAPFLNRTPFWVLSLFTWAVLSGAGFWLACRRLQAPKP